MKTTGFFVRALMALALIGSVLFVATPKPASAAALTSVVWSTSKAHPGDTNARYSYSFTTATAGTIKSVTFTVPTGTAGTPTLTDVYGLPTGTVGLASNTITFTVTTAVSVAANTPILIQFDGITNTSTPGTYTSNVTTLTSAPATIDGATASSSVTFDANTSAVTATVARILTFDNNAGTITMLLDPSLAALKDKSDTSTQISVATNAGSGYVLNAKASTLAGGGYTIPAITSGTGVGVASGSFTVNTWGFTVPNTLTSGSASGAGTLTRAGQLASSNFVGHTTTDRVVATQTAPTAGDVIPITHRIEIDYLQPATTYTSTITYTAQPSY